MGNVAKTVLNSSKSNPAATNDPKIMLPLIPEEQLKYAVVKLSQSFLYYWDILRILQDRHTGLPLLFAVRHGNRPLPHLGLPTKN